jgi:hypothetical protein
VPSDVQWYPAAHVVGAFGDGSHSVKHCGGGGIWVSQTL